MSVGLSVCQSRFRYNCEKRPNSLRIVALSMRGPQIKVQDQSMNHVLSQSLTQIIHIRARAHRWPMLALLDASSHLYKRVCPSVRPSVRRSVRRSVGRSVRRSVTHELKSRIWPILSKVMVQEGVCFEIMTNQATVRSTGTSNSASTSTNTCTMYNVHIR